MAGRPKEQAVRAALERLAHDEIDDDAQPIDWVCVRCAAADTLQDIADTLEPHCGFRPSEGWLALMFRHLAPDAKERIAEARTLSGEVLIGRSRKTLKNASTESRETFAKDAKLAELDERLAGRRDRPNLGESKNDVTVNVTAGTLHLEALRTVQPRQKGPELVHGEAPALPPGSPQDSGSDGEAALTQGNAA